MGSAETVLQPGTSQEPGRADRMSAIDINLSRGERLVSVLLGGALAVYGLSRRTYGGLVLAAAGAIAAARGAVGHCPVYAATGMRTAGEQQPIHLDTGVTINRPANELFAFWHDFDNLPRFMKHLRSVQRLENGRTRWVVSAPAGRTVEWDAEIIAEKANELIAWRTLPGASIYNAGSVRFLGAPGGRGTEVRVSLEYAPPAGPLGSAIARLYGENPEHQIGEDLLRFKQVMEAGEIATIEGQPSGRRQPIAGRDNPPSSSVQGR